MYTYPWYHWITFFYIYCFLGWIVESTYVSLQKRRLVNRGFLRLPMIPLYGTGAVMMLWVSLPVKDNLILVYIAGFFAASALEYVTGWIMERLFKMRYWDYSSQKFNINGYVCLGTSIAWGFLTILMTEVLHKPIEKFVLSLSPAVEFSFLAIVSVLFVTDAVQSIRAALDLGHTLESLTKNQSRTGRSAGAAGSFKSGDIRTGFCHAGRSSRHQRGGILNPRRSRRYSGERQRTNCFPQAGYPEQIPAAGFA